MAYSDITDDGQLVLEVDAALKRLRIAALSADDFLLRSAVDDLRKSSDIPEFSTFTVGPSRRLQGKISAPIDGRLV